ncbi:hypothetical protein D3C81_919510 [compost metagenome]
MIINRNQHGLNGDLAPGSPAARGLHWPLPCPLMVTVKGYYAGQLRNRFCMR